jgi:uncharacterized protein YndB with AHSA1/START domain
VQGLAVRLLLLMLALATPAFAWEPDATALEVLRRSEPFVEVMSEPGRASGLIHGAIEIAAPPERVWRTMTDCQLAPRMVARLKTCRILERDPAGHWDVREHVSRTGFLPPVRNVIRSDYEPPRRLRFHRVGGDLEVFEGEWRLVSLNGGARTRVVYENRAAFPFAVPRALGRMALRHDVPLALEALRRESLAAAP